MAGASLLRWTLVAAATAAAAGVLALAGLPSAAILGALGVGVAVALRFPGALAVGHRPAAGAQALVGTAVGTTLTSTAVGDLAGYWLPVLLTTVAMFALSLALGLLVRRVSRLDAATATLASVPGGAIGVVAMARGLGGDDRLVAFSQYLRVLVILVLTPLLVVVGLGSEPVAGDEVAGRDADLAGSAIAIALTAVGWFAGRRIGLPGGALLGPLLLAAAWTVLLPGTPIALPAVLREAAFALVGLDVGLRFTREAVREARRALPAFLLALAILLTCCFGLAVALERTTDMTLLDAHLATTPGGLTVVAATAAGTGADTGLVGAIQSVRMILMLLVAPAAVRLTVGLLARPRGGSAARHAECPGDAQA